MPTCFEHLHVYAVNCSAQPVLLSEAEQCCGTSPAQCLSVTLFSAPPSGSCAATSASLCRDSTGACGIVDEPSCAAAGACVTAASTTSCTSPTRGLPGVCDGTGHCGASLLSALDLTAVHLSLLCQMYRSLIGSEFEHGLCYQLKGIQIAWCRAAICGHSRPCWLRFNCGGELLPFYCTEALSHAVGPQVAHAIRRVHAHCKKPTWAHRNCLADAEARSLGSYESVDCLHFEGMQ